jgi:hypothetical protein
VKSAFFIAAIALATRATAQLSLTPTISERTQEGVVFRQLQFSDSGKKVTYEQPRGWTYSAQGKQKIVFFPPNPRQTKAEIEAGLPLLPAKFDEEGLKQLKSIFLSLLPKESEEIEVTEQSNPVHINGRESHEFTAVFVNHGQRYRMSVLFANLEREQLRCKVIAAPIDFEQAHQRFIESLYGLQWSP